MSKYMSIKIREDIYKRLTELKLQKILGLQSWARITFSDLIKGLIEFYKNSEAKEDRGK